MGGKLVKLVIASFYLYAVRYILVCNTRLFRRGLSIYIMCNMNVHTIYYSLEVLTVTYNAQFEIRSSAERHSARARACVCMRTLAAVNLNNVFLPKSTPSFCTRTYVGYITTLGWDIWVCVCVCVQKNNVQCFTN